MTTISRSKEPKEPVEFRIGTIDFKTAFTTVLRERLPERNIELTDVDNEFIAQLVIDFITNTLLSRVNIKFGKAFKLYIYGIGATNLGNAKWFLRIKPSGRFSYEAFRRNGIPTLDDFDILDSRSRKCSESKMSRIALDQYVAYLEGKQPLKKSITTW